MKDVDERRLFHIAIIKLVNIYIYLLHPQMIAEVANERSETVIFIRLLATCTSLAYTQMTATALSALSTVSQRPRLCWCS